MSNEFEPIHINYTPHYRVWVRNEDEEGYDIEKYGVFNSFESAEQFRKEKNAEGKYCLMLSIYTENGELRGVGNEFNPYGDVVVPDNEMNAQVFKLSK